MSERFSSHFEHYLPPTPDAVKSAMTSGLVVLDTNILLNAGSHPQLASS
jgi:hypothetical protein